jgi:glyoxylase-like metal-dependent hydrolase (beta-lactamase superfamily II)
MIRRFLLMLWLPLSIGPARAAEPASASTLQPIAEDIWWLPGAFVPGRQPDGNSVLLRGPKGWIVVDSGRHAAHGAQLLDFVAAQGGQIEALVNTHWHLDHISGNPRLRAAHPGLEVHASDAIDAALEGFLARSRAQLVQMRDRSTDAAQRAEFEAEIARIDSGPALRPDRVVRRTGTRRLAGRRVTLGYAPHSVTAGDVWLFDPATRVLVSGDLVTLPAPFLDTACPARWRATLAQLEATGFELLVPGHGAPMRRQQFQVYRAAFDALLDCADTKAGAGVCVQGWLDAAAPLLGDAPPELTRGLVEYYVEQRLRGDAAQQDCPVE